MKVIAIMALLAAITAGYLAHPLMIAKDKAVRRKAALLILFFAVAAPGLYLWRGMPDMPSRPALFEASGPRAAQRDLDAQELSVMKTLAAHPDDTESKTALGEIYYAKGLAALTQEKNAERARIYFDNALQVAPQDAPYRTQLATDRKKLNSRD